ncbi:MAG: hypothetical protein JKY71_01115 [Alphaproteobacteria bacterium]|nr:hypothetical protein [Alphaproteobacteria bacterium]
MSIQTQQELEDRFDALINYIKDAQIQVNQGKNVDLNPLQGQIEAVCADMNAAEKNVAEALKPKFIEMITTLDGLAGSLHGIIDQENKGKS